MSKEEEESSSHDTQLRDQMNVGVINENSKSREAGLWDEANEYERPTKNVVGSRREFGDSKILYI